MEPEEKMSYSLLSSLGKLISEHVQSLRRIWSVCASHLWKWIVKAVPIITAPSLPSPLFLTNFLPQRLPPLLLNRILSESYLAPSLFNNILTVMSAGIYTGGSGWGPICDFTSVEIREGLENKRGKTHNVLCIFPSSQLGSPERTGVSSQQSGE